MIPILKSKIVLWFCVMAATVAIPSRSSAQEGTDAYRHYHVDAKVISLDAAQSIASHRTHGAGGGTPGATLGYATPNAKITIKLTVESNRFYADVTLRGRGESNKENEENTRIDLTNLRPTFLDLGADRDGRTYQLNLTPSVVTVRLSPISFREAADEQYRLRFHSSRLVLNDEQYIGRMLASDAEVFSVEICGVASLEFSLLHLKNSEPWGRLKDGQITLNHPDGTSIEIGNVTNGANDRLIRGGPYVVWVRWGKPKKTVEEYRASLTAYRDRIASGAAAATAEALAAINQELAREPGPWVTSCGARGPRSNETVGGE